MKAKLELKKLVFILFTTFVLSGCFDGDDPLNVNPVVSAGVDQTVAVDAVVTLQGVARDIDGTIASYAWEQTVGSNVTLSSTNTASTSFTAPSVNTITELVFQLTVTDDGGDSSSDTVSITVEPVVMATSVKVSGIIQGDGPLMDVEVTSGGVVATTNAAGAYVLDGVPVADGQIQVTAEAQGFAPQHKMIQTNIADSYVANLALLRYAVVETLDTTQQQVNRVMSASGDMQLEFDLPANAFTTTDGEVYSVNMAYGDPSTEDGRAVFPGDYLGADDAIGANTNPLESIAFSEITITDSQGNAITQFDQPAMVTSRLPDVFQTGGTRESEYSAGSTIAWWSYDENAMIWVREDADNTLAGIQDALIIDMAGTLYAQAEVMHLTWWNVDRPLTEHACLSLVVTDEQGNPIPFLELSASGVTYNGISRSAYTDANGEASLNVMRSQNGEMSRVALNAIFQGQEYPITVANASDGVVGTNEFFTPEVQGSTLNNSGECKTLAVSVTIETGSVFGNVSNEFTGAPANGVTVFTSFGIGAETDAQGNYEIEGLPFGDEFQVFVDAEGQQTITLTTQASSVEQDFIKLNESPVITSDTKDPAGLIANNENANLAITFFDPENESVTIAWTTDVGTLGNTSTANVVWTAPATGTGVAVVNAVVTDVRGNTDLATFRIAYGIPNLNLTMNISVSTNGVTTPAEGAYVILHDQTTGEPLFVFRADANGAVIIENAPDNSLVTLAHEFISSSGVMIRELKTLYDVSPQHFDIAFDRGEFPCETDSVNVSFENYPAGIVIDQDVSTSLAGSVRAFNGVIDQTNRSVNFTNAQRCSAFGTQTDGKTSILATMSKLTPGTNYSESELLAYGYLLDQDTALNSYTGQMDQLPTEINFTASQGVNGLSMAAIRKGATYYGTEIFYNSQTAPALTSGSFTTFADFPADYFFVSAFKSEGSLDNFVRQDFVTLPTTLDFVPPNLTIGNFVYNFSLGDLSWDTDAGSTIDIGLLEVDNWSFYLSGDRSTIRLPQLPVEIQDWPGLDFSSPTLSNEAEIDLLDIPDCNDFELCLKVILDIERTDVARFEQVVRGTSFYDQVQVINAPAL